MSKDFPLSVEMLLNILEVIAPFKHINKLREFVNLKLPPGFPVKVEIPVLHTVTAKITFQKFEFRDNISPSLFEIPKNYVEDSRRFPDLWPGGGEQQQQQQTGQTQQKAGAANGGDMTVDVNRNKNDRF